MNNNFCLYHQFTDSKRKEKSLSNANKHSKKYELNNVQKKTLIGKKNQNKKTEIQQFDDYKIHSLKDNSSKQLKFFTKEPQSHKYHNYSMKDIKSISSIKSERQRPTFIKFQNSKQFDDSFQQKIDFLLKVLCSQKIQKLENKITDLTKKIQNCEDKCTKNHFQFVLMRDIVQRLNMQNLQLSSKVNASQNFIKSKKSIHLPKQEDQQIKTKHLFNHDCKIQTMGHQDNHKAQQKKNQSQQIQISNNHKKLLCQLNCNEQSTLSQKLVFDFDPYQICHEPFEQISKKISSIVDSEAYCLDNLILQDKIQFNSKKNRQKKVVNFQNTFKEQNRIQQQKNQQEEMIDNLFQKQASQSVNQNYSLAISSQQNLLQSVDLKKRTNRIKLQLTPQNQCSIDKHASQAIQNTIFRDIVDQKISLKQIQSRLEKMKTLLENIKQNQYIFKQDQEKVQKLKSQKRKLQQIYKQKQYQ